jgi:excisionase family DNA binding protein
MPGRLAPGSRTGHRPGSGHGTSERFPRRLIAERRIEFVKVGRHVRIRASVLDAFIASGVVAPITVRNYQQRKVA